jgi:hypothetical protein
MPTKPKSSAPESAHAPISISSQDKIAMLRRLLNGAAQLQVRDSEDAEFQIWKNTVERTLVKIYGQASPEIVQFKNLRFFYGVALYVAGDYRQEHRESFDRDFHILTSSIRHYIDEIPQDTLQGLDVNPANPPDRRHTRVFISHASADKPLVEELIELLEIIGLTQAQIFCTTVPGHGIELGDNFLEATRDELLGANALVVFLLTKAFYSSTYCLCEMGATWVLAKEHIPILVPPLDFADVRGVIPLTQGFKLNEPLKLNLFKTKIESDFGLPSKDQTPWEQKRNRVIERINSKIVDAYGQLPVVFDPTSNPDAVSLIELKCIPENPRRGCRIALVYVLESKVEGLRVWFGADLYRDGKYICDPNEDTEQILDSGWQVHQRYLSIPADLEPGTYVLHAAVWFGERSKTKLSQALENRVPDRMLTLE